MISNMGEKIGTTIVIILFWVILFGFLVGLDLIRGVFFVMIFWIYIIIKKGLGLIIASALFYLIYKATIKLK